MWVIVEALLLCIFGEGLGEGTFSFPCLPGKPTGKGCLLTPKRRAGCLAAKKVFSRKHVPNDSKLGFIWFLKSLELTWAKELTSLWNRTNCDDDLDNLRGPTEEPLASGQFNYSPIFIEDTIFYQGLGVTKIRSSPLLVCWITKWWLKYMPQFAVRTTCRRRIEQVLFVTRW